MLEGQWHCNHVLYQFEWVHNVKQCVQKVFKLAFKDLCLYSGVVCPCFQSDSLVLRAWWCHSSAFTTAQLKEKGMAMPCKALWMIFLGLQLQQQWSPLCSRHRRVFTTSSHWSSPNCWCWLSKLQEFTLTDKQTHTRPPTNPTKIGKTGNDLLQHPPLGPPLQPMEGDSQCHDLQRSQKHQNPLLAGHPFAPNWLQPSPTLMHFSTHKTHQNGLLAFHAAEAS